jgi:hypothetical protein
MKKGISGIILLFFTVAAFAVDFGVVLGADSGYADAIEPDGFSFAGYASPWISAVWNEKMSFHASGKLAYDYAENRESPGNFLFELERTELNLCPASSLYVTLGRQRFQDALGIVAAGLFDGAESSAQLGIGRFSLGAFYTGLLYKETAKIIMTSGDLQEYEKLLATGGMDAYFASRRALLALTGDFPALLPRIGLTAQGLAQFDLNDTPETLHSQYLELRLRAEILDPLHLEAGVLGELIQGAEGTQGSAALSAGVDWETPGALKDLLSAKFLWTSGRAGDDVCAFIPLGGVNAGSIYDPGLRALMSAAISYRARPLADFSAEAGTRYFIRTDLETLGDADLDASSASRLLGGELYGSLIWAPDPALMLKAGGGAFFPGWGGAFREGAATRWKLNLGLIFSL